MNKFCPQCGKLEYKSQPLVKGLCGSCFLKNNPILEQHKELKIVICPSCKSYLHQNKWHTRLSTGDDINLKEIIRKVLPEKLKLQQEAKINSLGIIIEDRKDKDAKKINIQLILNGIIHHIKSKEEYSLEVIKEESLCNLCKKKNSSYYEAKIQIRPKNENVLRLIKDFLSEGGKMFITKEEDQKFGYDLYLTNKKSLSGIISEVKKKFNIEVKISNTLYGRKDGREVFRTTALLRLKE